MSDVGSGFQIAGPPHPPAARYDEGMSKERKSIAAPILAVPAIVLPLLLALYVGGYFWLGNYITWMASDGYGRVVRVYPRQWMAAVYWPAATVEGWMTGVQTEVTEDDNPET